MGDIADSIHDDMLNRERDDEDYDYVPSGDLLRCKRCGATNLYWQEIVKGDGRAGFALFNESNHRKHECTTPDTDGFEAV